MDRPRLIVLPRPRTDQLERHVTDIDAAIGLVLRGVAVRVRLTALPDVDSIAGTGLAHAQAADLAFVAERDALGLTLTIGPRREAGGADPMTLAGRWRRS